MDRLCLNAQGEMKKGNLGKAAEIYREVLEEEKQNETAHLGLGNNL